jgi:cytochrome c556
MMPRAVAAFAAAGCAAEGEMKTRISLTISVRSWMAAALGAATCLAPWALAQDQSAATPKDAIFARKLLMSMVGDNMDELEDMILTGRIDMGEAHEHANNVSTLLLVFPHVFPPTTNQWKPDVTDRDAATDTYASPDLWTNFADFYQRANEASTIAFNASRANNESGVRSSVAALRQACDGCHARYMKTQ